MNIYILTITILLLGLILWLLSELARTAKHLTDKNYNHDRSDIVMLVALLAIIILIVPYFFTLPIFNDFKSNGSTGEIGDTIGGLTSPFINGIGAILVYLAFKEQVKATHQTRNLEQYKIINDRLNWLKGDPYDIVALETTINASLVGGVVQQHQMNQAIYLLIEFEELFDMSSKLTEDRDNLIKQVQYLYRILYRDRLTNVQQQSINFTQFFQVHAQTIFVAEYLLAFQSCDNKLGI